MKLSDYIKTEADSVLYRTTDPTVLIGGRPVPALTSLLLRACQDDPDRFEEATRIGAAR